MVLTNCSSLMRDNVSHADLISPQYCSRLFQLLRNNNNNRRCEEFAEDLGGTELCKGVHLLGRPPEIWSIAPSIIDVSEFV